MIVTCERCKAGFNVDENLLTPSGSKVRCSKCDNVFLAYPSATQEEPVKPTEAAPDLEAEQEDLDLEAEEEKAPETEEVAEDAIEELKVEVERKIDAIQGLDLDLEAEEEKAPEPEEAAEDAIEDLDLELDLETEEEKTPETEEVAEDAVEELELDLDMDMEPESEPVSDDAAAVQAEEPDELDLSDLEEMLDVEEVTEAEEEVAEDAVEELELDLDMDMEPESEPVSDDAAAVQAEEPDELDLSDLEEMLDVEEVTEAEEEAEIEEVELELDMDMGLEVDASDDVAAKEPDVADLEELSELEEMLELDMDDEAAAVDLPEDTTEDEVLAFDEIDEDVETSESVELEFEDALSAEPEEAEPAEVTEDDFLEETHVMEPGALLAAAGVGEEEEEEEEEERPIPVKKKRISMPVLIGLVAVLLAGAAYGTLTFLNSKNIRVPFISDLLFEPQVEDAGNLMITPLGVNGKFVENAKTGQLFVITGRVKNDYSHNRRFIKVTGKLFTKGKGVAKTTTVFCGNFLSDIELANFDFAAIKKRLMNRYGDKKSNLTIKPGQMIPFMVVFSNLPNNLDEFSVEVTESIQG